MVNNQKNKMTTITPNLHANSFHRAIALGTPARELQRSLRMENARFGRKMERIPMGSSDRLPAGIVECWRSRDFLAALWRKGGQSRLTVNRTMIDGKGNWLDGITWDDLQRIKSECGFGAVEAVEVYPADTDVVNVANMRHLWILNEPLPFIWRGCAA